MNKHFTIRVLLLLTAFVSFSYGAQAKFLLTPLTPTHMQLVTGQTVTVKYNVLNQTKLTRTLTTVPIAGFTPITTGSGVCSNPFTLAPNASCILTLQVSAPTESPFTLGGPQVCKTKSATDNNPDPFLCSQPSTGNQLLISSVAASDIQRLTIYPSSLTLTASGSSGTIKVTNHSFVRTINNVQANLSGTALDSYVTQDASDCTSIPPNGTCVLTFTPQSTAVSLTDFPIEGSNSLAVGASITINNPAAPTLIVTNSPLIINSNSSSNLTVKNISTTVAAYNITATLSSALINAGVSQNSSACSGPIAPGGQCNIVITSSSTPVGLSSGLVIINGNNINSTGASSTQAYVAVNGTVALSASPSSLTLLANGTSTGQMTITNSGTGNASNVQAVFTGTALAGKVTATTCDSIPANGGTCNMIFTAGYQSVDDTTFSIASFAAPYGSTTATLNIESNISSYLTSYASSAAIDYCPVNSTSMQLENCSNVTPAILSSQGGYLAGNAVSPDNAFTYILGNTYNFVTQCAINPQTQALDSFCQNMTDSAFNTLSSIAINDAGTYAYITNYYGGNILVCPIIQSSSSSGQIGSFGACVGFSSGSNGSLRQIALNSSQPIAYFVSDNNRVYQCSITNDGASLSSCAAVSQVPSAHRLIGLTIDGSNSNVYVVDFSTGYYYQCPLTNGNLPNICDLVSTGTGANNYVSMAAIPGSTTTNVYAVGASNESISQCSISGGTFGECAINSYSDGITMYGITLFAY